MRHHRPREDMSETEGNHMKNRLAEPSPHPPRRWGGMKDVTFLGILLVLALSFLVGRTLGKPSSHGNVAIVSVDGKEIARYVLSDYAQEEPVEFYFLEQHHLPVSVVLQEGTIRFSQVDCPDQICVNTGVLREDTHIAVCMPNKTSISVYTGEQAAKLKQ